METNAALDQLASRSRYLFAIMAHTRGYAAYERIESIVREHLGMPCVRSDDVPAAGFDLLAKISLLIKNAAAVVADITKPSPNLFYEVGYATAVSNPPLLIMEEGTVVPTDLVGLPRLEYPGSAHGTRSGWATFEAHLIEHLHRRLDALAHEPAGGAMPPEPGRSVPAVEEGDLLPAGTSPRRSIFISHIEEDAPLATQIAGSLEEHGYTTWYFERDSVPGVAYTTQVGQAIEQAKVVLVVISPASLGSRQVTNEIVQAFETGKHFIPILNEISHAQFQKRQPQWRLCLGAATSVPIPPEGVSAVIPRIVDGLRILGVGQEGA